MAYCAFLGDCLLKAYCVIWVIRTTFWALLVSVASGQVLVVALLSE